MNLPSNYGTSNDDILSQVKTPENLRAYLEQITEPRGNAWVCPMCGSGNGPHHTPAFHLNGDRWKCFACNEGGDLLDLIGKVEGIDGYTERLHRAAEVCGITTDAPRPPRPRQTPPKVEREQTDYTIGRERERAYIEASKARIELAADYLAERGWTVDEAREYGLGYDPSRRRLIIPWPGSDFYHIDRDVTGEAPRKYEYPRINDVGPRPTYNPLALEQPAIIVVEGAMDAMAVMRCGIGAVVALGGTGHTQLVGELQSRHYQGCVVVMLDNDKPGMEAQARLCSRLADAGIAYQAVTYADGCGYKDPDELFRGNPEGARAYFAQVIERATNSVERPKTSLDTFDDFMERIKTDRYRPYRTGIDAFDNLIGGGITRQSLVVLTAAPGAGKTALAQNIAEAIAADGQDVIYLNLEMSREYMYARSLSRTIARFGSVMSATDILRGYQWTNEQEILVKQAASSYRNTIAEHIRYNPNNCGCTLEDIVTTLERFGKAASDAGRMAPPVILDYLHLVTSAGHMDATEIVKKAISAMKDYAVRYDTFVIVIAATNRVANMTGKQTQNSARDSSAIEYTADTLIGLNFAAFADRHMRESSDGKRRPYSPENPDDMDELLGQNPRKMVVQVLKNRMSQPGGKLYLDFYAGQSLFAPSKPVR